MEGSTEGPKEARALKRIRCPMQSCCKLSHICAIWNLKAVSIAIEYALVWRLNWLACLFLRPLCATDSTRLWAVPTVWKTWKYEKTRENEKRRGDSESSTSHQSLVRGQLCRNDPIRDKQSGQPIRAEIRVGGETWLRCYRQWLKSSQASVYMCACVCCLSGRVCLSVCVRAHAGHHFLSAITTLPDLSIFK